MPRRALIATAVQVIDRADAKIEMECSSVDVTDPNVLGLLAEIGRRAQRRGVRVVLVRPSARLRSRLDGACLSDRFVIRA